jgi:hypothetical protein
MLKYCKGVPVILVGCKKDLLGDYKAVAQNGKAKQKQVTYEEVFTSYIAMYDRESVNHRIGRKSQEADGSVVHISRVLCQDW